MSAVSTLWSLELLKGNINTIHVYNLVFPEIQRLSVKLYPVDGGGSVFHNLRRLSPLTIKRKDDAQML